MTHTPKLYGALAPLLALAALAAPGKRPPQPVPATGAGTITLLTGLGAPFGGAGPLTEVAPGLFAGFANSPNGAAFLMTSKGTLTLLYTFPANTGVAYAHPLQAVNGRLYGYEGTNYGTPATSANFSLSLGGQLQTYPPTATKYAPILSIQLPDGSLYGTEAASETLQDNALVKLTLNGAAQIIHSFTKDEGIADGLPILGADGNFYGISGRGTGSPARSSSGMVYRITPAGDLTILATYPDGRNGIVPGYYKETLLQAGNGNFYGTAALGGSKRAGAVFEMAPDGTLTTLHEFSNEASGLPTVLIEGTDHNLYGVTQGTAGSASSLYRITLSGQFDTLQVINPFDFGSCPCGLTLGNDGKFYGTTLAGGPGFGTAWVWDLGLPPPQPTVTGVLPTSGATGSVVTVNGKFLLGATGVSFNGTPATTFSNISANYVSVTVPSGASTGPITVTTPRGSSTSAGVFTVE
jgi:uncharacterized repeat protein (TIGR03803 family)